MTIVALFFISWLSLGGFGGPVGAVGTLTVSGWLGWELVYRHHVAMEPVAPEERQIVESHERRRAA